MKPLESAIAFVEQAAVEARVSTIVLELTIDASNASSQALSLFADLAKTGAPVRKKGNELTIRVTDAEASSLYHALEPATCHE